MDVDDLPPRARVRISLQHPPAVAEITIMLGYQKLDVYRCAIRLLALINPRLSLSATIGHDWWVRRTDFIAAILCGGSWLIPACKEDVRPVSGRWEYHQRAETKNTCQFAARVDLQIGSFSLTADGDGTFIVDAQDGSSAIVCDIDGDDFDCELAVVFSYDGRAELNVDALVEVTVHHSGTFNSSVEGEGTSYYLTTCAGNDCGLASLSLGGVDFPCEIERTFHIQASRE